MYKNVVRKFKFIVVIGLIIFLITIVKFYPFLRLDLLFKEKIVYDFEGKKYTLFIADEESERRTGLMFFKKKPKNVDGMIFIFPEKEYVTFWNKNTYLDLYLYWFDDDTLIGKDFLPSIKTTGKVVTIRSPDKVNKVIELIKEE